MYRLRHTYTSAPAAERSVLLVNYENQRNAFKLVDIKSPPSPSAVNDIIYGSPRRWINECSTSPGHLIGPPPALCPAVAPERCDCVYSGDLQPCGCPRFFQTTSAMSPSPPDVTSELYAEDREVDDDDGPEVRQSRNCSRGLSPWKTSALCRGCAYIEAVPPPTLGDQQLLQQPAVDETTACWRSDNDLPCGQTAQSRRASSTDTASEPAVIAQWQAST